MEYVLGLDLGTSSLKGLVLNKQGEIIWKEKADYPMEHPEIGYSEQNPKHWIDAGEKIFKQLAKEKNIIKHISGISFSGQMHSLVLLDNNNEVLRNAILWNDVRNSKECDDIMSNYGKKILDITYNVALEGFTLPKILWIQNNEPQIWEKVRKILLPKDYLKFWLTSKFNTDYSDASGTLLLDLKEREWSREILEKYDIPFEYLPDLTRSSGYVGNMKDEIADKYGFNTNIKIFSGGADNACAALGSGIVNNQSNLISIGTSGVVLKYEEKLNPSYEGRLHVFHHATDEGYYSMGVTLAAGHSLNWFKKLVAQDENYEMFLNEISDVSPGSDGLYFTPYLVGERSPHMDSLIRGSFIGMDTKHEKKHFVRAVIEGITYSLKENEDIVEKVSNIVPDQFVLVGGGAQNSEWAQINADIFNNKIKTLVSEEGPGLGAALLAAKGLNWFDTFEEVSENFIEYKDTIYPIDENVDRYIDAYSIYKEIYGHTKDLSASIQKLLKDK